jgi:acyl carrier protein
MTSAEITSVLKEVLHKIAPEADLNRVGPNENLREALDIDSFDFLNFLSAIHDKLGVDVPESHYGRVRTLSELVSYLSTRIEGR